MVSIDVTGLNQLAAAYRNAKSDPIRNAARTFQRYFHLDMVIMVGSQEVFVSSLTISTSLAGDA